MKKLSNCPACGSDRIQKAKILIKGGISISSEVAKKLSPPVESTSAAKPAGRFSICIGIFLLIIGGYSLLTSHTMDNDYIGSFFLIAGVTLGFLGILLLVLSQIDRNGKKPKYEEDYAKWERLLYCSHCRNTFYDP